MKKNLLLTIASLCCKAMCIGIILSFAIISVVLVHWHFDPAFYEDNIFLSYFHMYGPETFFGYTITETWTTADTLDVQPFALSNLKLWSLYFIYLQYSALMLCSFLVFKEGINIIASVKLHQSFRIENFKSFRKMGNYLFYLFCLSSFYFVFSEYGNFYGFFINLTPLILMMVSYIMAEIFKEGHVLQEEIQSTI